MEYVGRTVKKVFQGYGIFTGTVRSYDSSRGYFRIEYEDGDTEDLDSSEMRSLLHDVIGGDDDDDGQAIKRRRLGEFESGNNYIDCNITSVRNNDSGLGGELDLNAAGTEDLNLNANFNLNEGLDLNCMGNEGLDLIKGVIDDDDNFDVEGKVGKNGGEIIDLNLEVSENENLDLVVTDKLTDRKGHCFDLNLGLEEESKAILGGDCEGELKDSEQARMDAVKGEEENCGSEALEKTQCDNVEEKGWIGHPESDLFESDLVEIEVKTLLDIDGSYTGLEFNAEAVSGIVLTTPTKRRGRKRKVPLEPDANSVTETVLRRSTRRARKAALLDQNNVSITAVLSDALNDSSSSPAVSAVAEEKVTELMGHEVSEELNVLPPKLELPPSSANLNLEGMPVLDVFFVYSFLRSFSTLLFLSPFELEDFVACITCNGPNLLFDSIHVSLLHTLRKHLESLSEESSESASNCLRYLNWNLLDMITWPIFMAEYLLMYNSRMKPGFGFGCLKLFESEYYKQSPSVKIEILRCLCDDVIEVESIKSELNRRSIATEPRMDFDQGMKCETTKKRKTAMDITGGSCVTEEDNNETLDWNSDECCLCKTDGNLICCDGCPAAFHSRCVGIVSNHLPEGDWYCPECTIEKNKPWMKVGKSIRGADLLGIDPYGQLYYSCCGYLLVLQDCHSETSLKYYFRSDLPTVIEAMKSSEIIYYAIISAIIKQWDLSSEVDGAKEEMGSQQCVSVIHERQIPATSEQFSLHSETHLRGVILDEGRADDKTLVSNTDDNTMNVGNQNLSVEVSAGVSEAITGTHNFEKARFDLRSRHTRVSDKFRTPEKLVKDHSPRFTPLGKNITDSAEHGHVASTIKARILSQQSCGTSYTNHYSLARTASAIAEELTRKLVNKNSEATLKSVDEIILEQMKAISDKFMDFCWPNVLDINADARKENCGWCFACKVPEDGQGCLVTMYCNSPPLEKFTSEMLGIRSRKNKRSHLVDIMFHLLCTEHRLHGLLLGPWLNPMYSNFWRKGALKVTGIAPAKGMLLKLESNLHHLALSTDWTKHVDSAAAVGSAIHVISSSTRGSLRNVFGRKRARCPEPEATMSSKRASGLGLLWWRGGRLSRQIFDWKVLPRTLVSKAARQAGCKKIPGILYPDGSEFAKRSKYVAWRAAVESSRSVEQLALQVRELDANIRWDDIDNTNLSLKLEESKKPIRSFKKVIVRRKCLEGTVVKYLLDFGKRRFIPDIVVRHGFKVEESERKKYWLEESHLPLHLLKSFEQKRIARRSNKISAKFQERRRMMKQHFKKKGFSYLFSRAERWENYQCGHCNKDVLIREAVSCQYCKGFFHKRHVRKSAGAITFECTYTCHKCQEGNHVKTDAKKEKIVSKKRRKASKQLRSLQSKIKKKVGRDEQLRQNGTNKKAPVVVPLRRSPRKAKCVSLQNKKIRAHKRGKQSKSKRGASKKQLKSAWQKKRTRCCPIYWLNGLHLSKKPSDERLLLFKSKKLLLLCGESTDTVDNPRCSLCCEQEVSPMLNYIACEICGDWFHGDALDLKVEQIDRLIGFKCYKCLGKNPPCCPHFGATRTEQAKLVDSNTNDRIDSIHEEISSPSFSSEALVEQNFEFCEESKNLSLAVDHDERQLLGNTVGSNRTLGLDDENGQLTPSSVQKTDGILEFCNDDSGHPDKLMALEEENLLKKDAINLDKLPTTPVETGSLSCKSAVDVSEKNLTSLLHNCVENGVVNQRPIFHSVVKEAFDSAE